MPRARSALGKRGEGAAGVVLARSLTAGFVVVGDRGTADRVILQRAGGRGARAPAQGSRHGGDRCFRAPKR